MTLGLNFLTTDNKVVQVPSISDKPEIAEQIKLGTGVTDNPEIKDSTSYTDNKSKEEVDYWVDEQGNRHYGIKVGDSPVVGD